MMIEKNIYGYWIVSDIIKGYLIERKYLYYTKEEAIRMFKKEFKGALKWDWQMNNKKKERIASWKHIIGFVRIGI